ncbi:MAG: hypothetical protein U5L03_04155 [Burkholderiaceae bacterium]|nr:hypothetical protein [Burkholderiaceae bacterium]
MALTAVAIRQKLQAVLREASGRAFADADIERFLDGLPFAATGTYGGHYAA